MVHRLGGRRHLPLRPLEGTRATSTPSTPRPPPCRDRSTSATSSPTPTPTWWPASTACAARRSSTRWGGTTTACPPSGGCRTTSGCAATPPSPTTRTSRRRPSRRPSPWPSRAPTSSSSAASSPPRTSGPSRSSGAPSASRSTGTSPTRASATSQRASQRSFLRLLAGGHVYQHEAPTLWDVDFRTAVSQAELEDRERPGAYHRLRFARAGGEAVEIETTRPELLAACVALVAHPDDARYRPLLGTEVATPLFKARVPVVAHPLADPEKGTGVAMVCTFGDLTDVVWWRELDLPTRTVLGRDGRLLPVDLGRGGVRLRGPRRGGRRLRRAGRPHGQAGPGEGGGAAGRLGRPGGRAAAHHPSGQVLREGRAPTRDRLVPPVVRPHPRPAPAAAGPRRAAALAPGPHGPPLPRLGGGAGQRLEHQPAAVLRGALPGVVPGGRRRGARLRPPAGARRGPAAGRPVDRRPRRLHRGPAGPAGGLRGRPRRDGHLGHLLAHPAHRRPLGGRPRPVRPGVPHGPAPPGPRHHPDVAVLDRGPRRARVRLPAVVRRGHLGVGARPRHARRCPSPRGTW